MRRILLDVRDAGRHSLALGPNVQIMFEFRSSSVGRKMAWDDIAIGAAPCPASSRRPPEVRSMGSFPSIITLRHGTRRPASMPRMILTLY